jgi:ATP-dependent Clp protease ATP-binding subunit ClpB
MNDVASAEKSPRSPGPSGVLIRGRDHLAAHPGFALVGRDDELAAISNVLLRQNTDNLILTGRRGVGLSSILLGLQASKDRLETPFDIVGKRFFWLDTDGLFASGDPRQINEGLQRTLKVVTRAHGSVLVINDFRDLIDAARAHGCSNVVNALMREARTSRELQLIVECRDTDLPEVLRCHSAMTDFFVIKEIGEPLAQHQDAIVAHIADGLARHHGIPVSPEARAAALELTNRYHVKELDCGQPKRAEMLLEGALTNYRRAVHARMPALDGLEARLAEVRGALAGGKPGRELEGRTPAALAALGTDLEREVERLRHDWEARQTSLRRVYGDQRTAEDHVHELDAEIEAAREAQALEAQRRAEAADASAEEGQGQGASRRRLARLAASGLDNETIARLKEQKAKWDAALAENKARYQGMTAELNRGLVLTADHVYAEFSRLSGIEVGRLREDEATKLLELEATLAARVFGQPDPVREVAKAVKRGRTGLKKRNKPVGSFIFLGPTGVGKTELAKALATALFGDERMLRAYDMSEYQEKHAVSALIGAPPGYEGYEYGGLLTNAMREHPRCVNVFDEIEKAHKDVFDLFLQIVDEGRLTDRRGLVASFADSVNILTSNIGQAYFLDEKLSFEEARAAALRDLWDPKAGGYRGEFLARFTGIFCFDRLGLPTIELIAERGLAELNSWIGNPNLRVSMAREDLAAMCRDQYDPRRGARSITVGWIENQIASEVADILLRHPQASGTVAVRYDVPARRVAADLIATPGARPAESA